MQSVFEKINEIANVCLAILETETSTSRIRNFVQLQNNLSKYIKEHPEFLKKNKTTPLDNMFSRLRLAADNIQNNQSVTPKHESLSEDEEQSSKKHWTQHQPSATNRYFQRKYGKKNQNNYEAGQDVIKQSYNNYLDSIAKQQDLSALEKYKQAKYEVSKLVNLAKQGKISWKEINKAQRAAQKLRPSATSDITKERFEKNQNNRYSK